MLVAVVRSGGVSAADSAASFISAKARAKMLFSMARARLRRQASSAAAWARWSSISDWGLRLRTKSSQKRSKTSRSVGVRTLIWPVMPWRTALRLERALPCSVLGPVESWQLRRLASICCREVSGIVSPGLVLTHAGRGKDVEDLDVVDFVG